MNSLINSLILSKTIINNEIMNITEDINNVTNITENIINSNSNSNNNPIIIRFINTLMTNNSMSYFSNNYYQNISILGTSNFSIYLDNPTLNLKYTEKLLNNLLFINNLNPINFCTTNNSYNITNLYIEINIPNDKIIKFYKLSSLSNINNLIYNLDFIIDFSNTNNGYLLKQLTNYPSLIWSGTKDNLNLLLDTITISTITTNTAIYK